MRIKKPVDPQLVGRLKEIRKTVSLASLAKAFKSSPGAVGSWVAGRSAPQAAKLAVIESVLAQYQRGEMVPAQSDCVQVTLMIPKTDIEMQWAAHHFQSHLQELREEFNGMNHRHAATSHPTSP